MEFDKKLRKQLGTTMYKNNSRFSSNIKGCSPLQLSCNLTIMRHYKQNNSTLKWNNSVIKSSYVVISNKKQYEFKKNRRN